MAKLTSCLDLKGELSEIFSRWFLFFFIKISRPDSQHSVISLKNSFVANYENEKENINDVLLIHKVYPMFDILSHSRFKRAR
jgi:hypothetical protein